MQLMNLVIWTKNDTKRNRSDEKRARPVFDIKNGTDNTAYGSGTKTNELSIVLQSYRRSRKKN